MGNSPATNEIIPNRSDKEKEDSAAPEPGNLFAPTKGTSKNGGAPGGRALPNQRFPEDACYGRGAGVGLDCGTGVDLGVVVAVGVGVVLPVGVAVGVDVGVAVAVGVGEPEGAQYLPPVLK